MDNANYSFQNSEFPPLYPAILEMQCDIAKLLLTKGADVSWTSQVSLTLNLLTQ